MCTHSCRRFAWLLVLSSFMITNYGCASSSQRSVKNEIDRDGTGLLKESGLSIGGYVLRDGTEVVYGGRVRLVESDRLVFWKEESVRQGQLVREVDVPGPVYEMGDVLYLEVISTSTGRSVLFGVATLAAVTTIGVLAEGGVHQH